jgi:hypothetical protein
MELKAPLLGSDMKEAKFENSFVLELIVPVPLKKPKLASLTFRYVW